MSNENLTFSYYYIMVINNMMIHKFNTLYATHRTTGIIKLYCITNPMPQLLNRPFPH